MEGKNWIDPFRGVFQSDQYPAWRSVRKAKDKETGNRDEKNKLKNPQKYLLSTSEKYYEELYTLYANVLDARGYNINNTFEASMKYFNKTQMHIADPVTNGKTYIFITRPDLNFWHRSSGVRNVEFVNLFNYMSKMEIGAATMPWLMFPNGMKLEFDHKETSRAQRMFVGKTPIWVGDSDELYRTKSNAFTPFIPILSNTCTSASGAKDLNLETKSIYQNYQGDNLQFPNGFDESFGPGEITLEFDDIFGSPVLHLINLWVNYMHYYSKGIVVPWGVYSRYRIYEATSSIYIFMTDRDNSTILRWARWMGSFPKGIPLSNIQHNLSISSDALRNVSVPFAYNRYEPMNPASLVDFNFLMNRFLFPTTNEIYTNEEANATQLWMKKVGISPERLIKPIIEPVELIKTHKNWHGPLAVKSDKPTLETEYKNKAYYDNQFWGTIPYIIDHKLVWLDPNQIDWSILDENRKGWLNDIKAANDPMHKAARTDQMREMLAQGTDLTF